MTPVGIYDWQGHGEENHGVGPWATDSVGDTEVTVIQNTGTGYNYEQIELLEPDLILNVRAASDDKVFDRLSQIAPVATAPEDAPDFAVDWRTQTEIIGQAIGKDEEAAAAIAETDQVLSETAEANPDFEGTTFVYGVKFGDAYGGYVAGDARFDVFGELGLVQNPALAELATPGGFFAAVAAEQVTAFEADVAVLTTIGMPLEELTGDATLNSLDVTSDGRAIILEETDEINVALAAGTPESIALAVEGIEPQLAAAVAKVG
nr:ABC transporter substrate-binding protein [Ornithinimicrobium sp. F0845]